MSTFSNRTHSLSASEWKATFTCRNISSFLQGSSHPLAFCFSTWLHLQTLPITWARGCISSLIKPSFGASLLPSMAACSWLQIFCRWPRLTQIFWDSELHNGSTGDCFLVVTPTTFIGFPALVSLAKGLCPCIINWIPQSWSFNEDHPELSLLLSHSASECKFYTLTFCPHFPSPLCNCLNITLYLY